MQKKLGEILVERGYVAEDKLHQALRTQKEEGSELGRILIGQDYLTNLELHKALAERFGVPFVDLIKTPPPRENLQLMHRTEYHELELLPYDVKEGEVTLAVCAINDSVRGWALRHYPEKQVKFVITSPYDILITLQKTFAADDDLAARMMLWLKKPVYSAHQLFSGYPWKSFICALLLVAAVVYEPLPALAAFITMMNLFFFSGVIFKTTLFAIGALTRNHSPVIKQHPRDFPVYTILLPLYKETGTLEQLIDALKKLDYPKAKLDVKFVVEADDNMTIEAIKALAPPHYMEIIAVPYSLPRTKPKACNYALQYARGEFVTIYDAEDRPDPQQLKKALLKFAEDERIACVQACLNYYNYNDSQLTRWFSLEYAMWFDSIMKGFDVFRLPIPLGGTSNHVRTRVLREIGGWDAFNVTEDAELGIRLGREGYRTATIDSLTEEEAPHQVGAWMKQRRRWLKGFMQTYIVHMRHVRKFVSKVGISGFMSFQYFIGLPILAYLSVPWLALTAIGMGTDSPDWLKGVMVFNLLTSASTHIIMAYIAGRQHRSNSGERPLTGMFFTSLTLPFYFLLHIIASYMALFQLISAPHYWDKTEHGKLRKPAKKTSVTGEPVVDSARLAA